MLVSIATNPKDFDRAIDLAAWMKELPCQYSRHTALAVGAFTLDKDQIKAFANKLREVGFRDVYAIQAQSEDPVSWPRAANAMWRLAADYVKDQARCSWLWLEPDSIPMSPGWLDRIEQEYLQSKKAFMGTLYSIPHKHMNGVGVYPANVRRFNPAMFNAEFFNAPFDVVRPDLTLRDAHITRLFCRSLADPATNTPHSFHDEASLSIIPPDCAVFHGCKDGSLIQRLREMAHPELKTTLEAPPATLGEKIVGGIKNLFGSHTACYHSGNLGDVMYALPAMRAAGIKNLIIGPQQRNTALCAVPIDLKQYEMLEPLLNAQSYLSKVSYSKTYPTDARDINHFRSFWQMKHIRERHDIQTLTQCHFYELGVLDKFDDNKTWLTAPKPIHTGKIICHRSPRYNAPGTGPESFPWQRIVNDHHKDMLFVGLESEYDSFVKAFGKRIGFWKVKHFLELAELIAGGKCFVGNQSFPLSVAIGLGQNVICEALPRSPDTRFWRDNLIDQLMDPNYETLTMMLTNP